MPYKHFLLIEWKSYFSICEGKNVWFEGKQKAHQRLHAHSNRVSIIEFAVKGNQILKLLSQSQLKAIQKVIVHLLKFELKIKSFYAFILL